MQATEQEVSLQTAEQLGLNKEEYNRIEVILGRLPNYTELRVFAVMWSEQCSYKNSIDLLRTLPREGKKLLAAAADENTGLMDIGNGLACTFKIKPFNHPSSIEPNQGAAMGVGEIHRDIYTKGARPIAALNSLRFGNLDDQHTKHLLQGVVQGISNHGNTLGIPTVGGELVFNDCYTHSILVNALSVGIVKVGDSVPARAEGPGNSVLIIGSKTGKDGVQIGTPGTKKLNENDGDKPSIQTADPLQGKVLMEAVLEAIGTGVVIGMRNMGVGGIARSSVEMCSSPGTGMVVHLDEVPTRQSDMKDWEILLSETQERILIVAVRGEEQTLYEIFEKWGLDCTMIGEVSDTDTVQYFQHSEKVVDIPVESLVVGGRAPVYSRKTVKPRYFSDIRKFNINRVKSPKNIVQVAKKLFASPNLVSKRWAYEQFDSTIRTTNLTSGAKADAAILRIKGYERTLALTIDCNAGYVFADPYVGAMIAVSEAARNITCSGGIPLATTNCLNFGDPYNPEVYYQFASAVKGIADACKRFEIPVIGGDVSFYNQTLINDRNQPIFPTPVIGMLGIIDKKEFQTTLEFKQEGDLIYMIGNLSNSLGSSEYLRHVLNLKYSPVPHFDLYEEFEIQKHIRKLIRKKIVRSAHDVSDGGLFTNLMESAIAGGLGFDIETVDTFRKDSFLFGESQGRIVITIPREQEDILQNYLINNNVSFTKLGEVFGDVAIIDEENFGYVSDWKRTHEDTLGNKLDN